jgi:predicted nuclease with TOPRIM domain
MKELKDDPEIREKALTAYLERIKEEINVKRHKIEKAKDELSQLNEIKRSLSDELNKVKLSLSDELKRRPDEIFQTSFFISVLQSPART